MIKKVKKTETEVTIIENIVKHLYKWKNSRMVRIEGNFMNDGFNISQNKVRAILENKDVLQKFINGEFNTKIDELQEDEILEF